MTSSSALNASVDKTPFGQPPCDGPSNSSSSNRLVVENNKESSIERYSNSSRSSNERTIVCAKKMKEETEDLKWLGNKKEIDKKQRLNLSDLWPANGLQILESATKLNRSTFIKPNRSNLSSRSNSKSIHEPTMSYSNKDGMKTTETMRNWILSTNQFDLILIIQFSLLLLGIKHVQCQQVFPPNQFK